MTSDLEIIKLGKKLWQLSQDPRTLSFFKLISEAKTLPKRKMQEERNIERSNASKTSSEENSKKPKKRLPAIVHIPLNSSSVQTKIMDEANRSIIRQKQIHEKEIQETEKRIKAAENFKRNYPYDIQKPIKMIVPPNDEKLYSINEMREIINNIPKSPTTYMQDMELEQVVPNIDQKETEEPPEKMTVETSSDIARPELSTDSVESPAEIPIDNLYILDYQPMTTYPQHLTEPFDLDEEQKDEEEIVTRVIERPRSKHGMYERYLEEEQFSSPEQHESIKERLIDLQEILKELYLEKKKNKGETKIINKINKEITAAKKEINSLKTSASHYQRRHSTISNSNNHSLGSTFSWASKRFRPIPEETQFSAALKDVELLPPSHHQFRATIVETDNPEILQHHPIAVEVTSSQDRLIQGRGLRGTNFKSNRLLFTTFPKWKIAPLHYQIILTDNNHIPRLASTLYILK